MKNRLLELSYNFNYKQFLEIVYELWKSESKEELEMVLLLTKNQMITENVQYDILEIQLLNFLNNIEGFKVFDSFSLQSSTFKGRLSLPDSLEEIGMSAFRDSEFTGDFILNPESNLRVISQHAFENSKFSGKFQIKNDLERIEEYSFTESKFLGDIVIPETLYYIGANALQNSVFTGNLNVNSDLSIYTQALESSKFSKVNKVSGYSGDIDSDAIGIQNNNPNVIEYYNGTNA